MKKIAFNMDDNWDMLYFYKIYEVNNIKHIKFLYETNRLAQDKPYLSWVVIYRYNCEMRLDDFLKLDVYYQLSELFNTTDHEIIELSPGEAFAHANSFLTDVDADGSTYKKLINLSIATPCGAYYGI